jgi:hypothetical protein
MLGLQPAPAAGLDRPGIPAVEHRERPDQDEKTKDEKRSHASIIGIADPLGQIQLE